MRKFVMLVAALGLVAGACGGDSGGGSCESVADDAIQVFQEVIDEFDNMTLEEAGTLDDEPAFVTDMEAKFEALQEEADDLGCSDAEMEELFLARIDNLTAEGLLGEMMIQEFQNQGVFE